jgi:predicted nuclease of predicted toxin-antitoxin system
MPEPARKILLDQNIPQPVSQWLAEKLPSWQILHVNTLGFQGKTDEFLYCWAQENSAIIITYDEDFADSRFYVLGDHHGVIRLRVWPTTIEKTKQALDRLMVAMPPVLWQDRLIIIDNKKIRSRSLHPRI